MLTMGYGIGKVNAVKSDHQDVPTGIAFPCRPPGREARRFGWFDLMATVASNVRNAARTSG